MTLPNMISVIRLVASLGMVAAGSLGWGNAFLVLFAFCLVSDFADGLLARVFNCRTRLGARLDTWGDTAMYLCAAVGGAMLWPELVLREGPFFVAAIVLVGVSGAVALVKHRRLPAYHTWSAKASTAVVGVAAILLFAGVSPWPFRLSIAVLGLSAAEETAITLVLPEWQPNVRTVFHALRLRRRMATGQAT